MKALHRHAHICEVVEEHIARDKLVIRRRLRSCASREGCLYSFVAHAWRQSNQFFLRGQEQLCFKSNAMLRLAVANISWCIE